MITNTIKFIGSRTAPNPIEIDYWIDTKTDPYGTAIKYHNGIDWVNLFKHDNIDIDLANYYTKKQVDSKLSIKADTASVNNLFTALNNTKADKTSIYTKQEINDLFLNFDPFDETKYYTKVEIDTKGYLTEIPATYITEEELLDFTYSKQHIDNTFATTKYVNEEIAKAILNEDIDLTGYATEQWVNDQNYLTEHQDISHLATIQSLTEGLNEKVSKVENMGLSSNDFTTVLKDKLISLNNYNDLEINDKINNLRNDFDLLVDGNTTETIETFNEVIAFLEEIKDTNDLKSIIASIENQIAEKQNIIQDIEHIRNGAKLGASALQEIPSEYVTIEIMNESIKNKLDNITDLSDIRIGSKKGNTAVLPSDLSNVALTGSYDDLLNKPSTNEEYDPSEFSGLGRCHLHKNIIHGVNVLTQDMFTNQDGSAKSNTRYIIQYDYDLLGIEINLPSNCVLDFQGGSFKNGKIKGNNGFITGSLTRVFKMVRLTGTWLNDRCNLNWWDVYNTKGVDNSGNIQEAFRSNIKTIEVCGSYYISYPVQIPINSTVQGQSKDNNKLHGFYANDDFTSKSITLDGNTYTACGVLYTGSNYRTELNNIFVDARHKADYCVEHISNSVSWNIIKVGIFNARKVGILQYGCERAVFKNLYLYGNNVGLAIRYNTYNNNNPFDFSGAVKTIPNIITIDDVYAITNNVGMIIQYGTNVNITNVNTAHNSIVGLYLRGVTGDSCISNYYSEGDGCCSFYIDENGYINNSDGTRTGPIEVNTNPSFSNGKTIQTLIDKNLDGFSNEKSEPEYGQIVYQRAPLVIDKCNVAIMGAFLSVKPRGNSNTNETNVLPPTNRTSGGVDALILFRGMCNVFARSVSQYMTTNDTGSGLLTTFIEHVTTTPSIIDIGFFNGTRPIRFKTKYSERPLAYFKSTSTDNRYIGKTAVSFANKTDYNRNVEKSRYGATSNYNLKSGKLVETYKGVPLYLQNTNFKQAQYRMMYLTKEKALELFGDLKEVKIKFYIKVLEDIPSSYIYSSVQIMNGGSNVLNSIIASSNAQTIEAGYYEFESIVPVYTSAAYDQILISVRENTNAWDKVAYSDIFFYDPADGEMAKYEYTDKHLRRGSTNGRPQGVHYGFTYYDTLLGKGITSKGDDTWVDESGQTV